MKLRGLNFEPVLPLVGCMFPRPVATWDRHADDVTDAMRAEQAAWLGAQWPGLNNTRYIQTLLTAYGDDCPHKVQLFEGGRSGYGGDLDLAKINMVRNDARMIRNVRALWLPCLFNDDRTVYDQPKHIHERAIHLLTGQFNPYCVAWTIGLESSEYLGLAEHNEFCRLFKKYAPEHYCLTHIQWDGTAPLGNIDGILYEFPWEPKFGDAHNPAEVRDIGLRIIANANQQGKFVIFSEINLNVSGEISRAQNRALGVLANCVGIAGPV